MKLLFDENISPRLPQMLASEYPGSQHVREAGLRGTADQQIWSYARDLGFTIVSKDTDFRERSVLEAFPPKVIWLDVGNAGTPVIAELLRRERQRIEGFEKQNESAFLILSLGISAL